MHGHSRRQGKRVISLREPSANLPGFVTYGGYVGVHETSSIWLWRSSCKILQGIPSWMMKMMKMM
eukprot:12419595-Karenia_brevis.AAC.1